MSKSSIGLIAIVICFTGCYTRIVAPEDNPGNIQSDWDRYHEVPDIVVVPPPVIVVQNDRAKIAKTTTNQRSHCKRGAEPTRIKKDKTKPGRRKSRRTK